MTKGPTKSLQDHFPDLASQLRGWDPRSISIGSSRKLEWQCPHGHIWSATVHNRVKGSGCPFCSGLRPIAGTNDLATTHPDLASQAHGWDPSTVSAGSKKKMQWQCAYKHIWQAQVVNRTFGTGCPYCSGHKHTVGVNDLATTNPIIAAQADGWDPKTVSGGSSQRHPWICSLGHKWISSVSGRTRGSGCPYCSGQKVLKGFNDLATIDHELSRQADGWDPSTVTIGSGKTLSWKCSQGHSWKAAVTTRSSGYGCPYCSGHKHIVGVNDLATVYPIVAAQANGWDPTSVSAMSGKKKQWKCETGHIWEAAVSSRAQGSGCPQCSGHSVISGESDLLTIFPALAAQADGWDPKTVTSKSGRRQNWKCTLGHTWVATTASRATGNGCPVCANQVVLRGFNDLLTFFPEIAQQADGWDPTTITSNSGRKRKWKCSLGHSWVTAVSNRTSKLTGCPTCSNRQVLLGFNDLATTDPLLANQAYGWDPLSFTAGSEKKLEWKCDLGHVWKSTPANRHKGAGCLVCSNQQVLKGFNDLSTLYPDIGAQADGWDPHTVTPKSGKKAQWICESGHKWSAAIASRTNGHGCPQCSGHTVIVGVNDLATLRPDLAIEADGWDPTLIMPGTPKKKSWKCSEGHVWKAAVSSRNRGNGCPFCATHGFQPLSEGWLYLVHNDALGLLQIGISNVPDRRLAEHRKNGFESVLDVRGPMDGLLVQHLEQAMLKSLAKNGAVFANKMDMSKFDGWTESWNAESFNVSTIKQLLDLIYLEEETIRQ